MRLHKVNIVGGNNFNIILAGYLHQHRINLALLFVGLSVTARLVCLMALKLNVVVITKHLLEPEC